LALARLGNREAIPTMLDMLTGLNEEKAKSAAKALVILKGDSVVESLEEMLETQTGLARYRIIEMLYLLGAPKGKELLKQEALQIPTLRVEAALRLAPEGDLDAMEALRERLSERYDIQLDVIRMRARAAGALIMGGDRTRIADLQELLRLDFPDLKEPAAGNFVKGIASIVTEVVVETDVRPLMDIMQPVLLSPYPEARVSAASAIIALGDSALRARMLEQFQSN
jgi:HEAT repeat protein